MKELSYFLEKIPEIYPDTKNENFYGESDYTPMVKSFGEILIEVADNEYRGDTRYLLKNESKFGLLIIGWGSCSGCDALQATNTIQELAELMQSIENDVKWFDSFEELRSYVKNKDWDLEHSWCAKETREFVDKIINYQI